MPSYERRPLCRDKFRTAASGPLTSPRKCESGSGSLVLVQTGGDWSVTGGALTAAGGSGVPGEMSAQCVVDNGASTSNTVPRASELPLVAHFSASHAGTWGVGFWPTATLDGSPSAAALLVDGGAATVVAAYPTASAVVVDKSALTGLAVQPRAGGGFYVLGRIAGQWCLGSAELAGTDATLYAGATNISGAMSIEEIGICGAPFQIDTYSTETPALSTTYPTPQYHVSDLTVTTTGVTTGDVLYWYAVYQDATHYSAVKLEGKAGGQLEASVVTRDGGAESTFGAAVELSGAISWVAGDALRIQASAGFGGSFQCHIHRDDNPASSVTVPEAGTTTASHFGYSQHRVTSTAHFAVSDFTGWHYLVKMPDRPLSWW